jgi:hypothetical protein
MNLFQRRARVRAAQQRMHAATQAVSVPAAALLSRAHRHPLSTLGLAGGAGFVLGQLNVHPLRVPGVGAVFGGGLAEAVAYGTRLLADLGQGLPFGPRAAEAPGSAGDADPPSAADPA